jgi:phosphoribosylglycinamide formyltransferase
VPGSNLQALIDSTQFNLVHVLSNRSNAYGLTRATIAYIPSSVFALKPYLTKNPGKTREDYDIELAHRILELQPDLVVLAGWMHILSDGFLQALVRPKEQGPPDAIPIINLHPALPGAFDGAHAIARAYEAFQQGKISKGGVMVHRVIADVDKGEPLLVKEVSFTQGESEEAYEARIHQTEHVAIVEGTRIAVDHIKAALPVPV